METLSIIIPIYNEEHNIPALYARLKNVVSSLELTYEFVFVNDGSKDNSITLIKQLASIDPAVKYIDFSRNFGHQIAVTAGLDGCTGDKIVIIDADLQDPPELIGDMYAKMQEGYEVVYAKRRSRKGESFLKKYTAQVFYRTLASITSISIPVDTGDFRMIDRKIVDVLKNMPEQHKFLRGQISWIGFNQTFVEYDRDERLAGVTGYTYKKMIRFALDGITSFSDLPIRFATISGFVVSFIAFIIMLYALYSRFILQDYVPGWTSLILSVMFIGGIQLIAIGIIGEYISRISSNVRKRPLYIVREKTTTSKKD
ncbi:glycosyltransferase [Cytophaga hutchinsonii]|jgi:glycosyltransferase involved in cell wall biosynthesis|uniref:Candidate b-glycosyltransferase, Glycosyltransferase Family 2 protein n=1 Tax=Cytophaga hutchinsonii (strain ATCC 33406 / DSM 1761 / CIP 103989 / NBRC 15051 / NCIMB 9469 / D465) TaxID=269798 RepID=A0A6N4SU75_CYTH3|nr:glycosyltransferase [Cytophaga hutchinsonii]ABG59933.1 candidate b-glycosyltransferase, Glycosyltransferase Family 2 protein [Cytophaga hutchinsonii ATCC 33406]SFX27150.1 dolichol-phosphate mannosyltransferase [Cytophaga hutchinsonii ATCC 33406]